VFLEISLALNCPPNRQYSCTTWLRSSCRCRSFAIRIFLSLQSIEIFPSHHRNTEILPLKISLPNVIKYSLFGETIMLPFHGGRCRLATYSTSQWIKSSLDLVNVDANHTWKYCERNGGHNKVALDNMKRFSQHHHYECHKVKGEWWWIALETFLKAGYDEGKAITTSKCFHKI